jgi:hypothetical protein
MFIHTFENIRPGKKAEIEQLIRSANGVPFDHPENPDAVCFHLKKPRNHQDIISIWAKANGVSPDIKLTTQSG